MDDFSVTLGNALHCVASENGVRCAVESCRSWGGTGAMYLAHVLCSVPTSILRKSQYATREEYGPIVLDCRWYDRMCSLCLNADDPSPILLTDETGQPHSCLLSRELFLEMLDFCREG